MIDDSSPAHYDPASSGWLAITLQGETATVLV
jgi:hypothetical protein